MTGKAPPPARLQTARRIAISGTIAVLLAHSVAVYRRSHRFDRAVWLAHPGRPETDTPRSPRSYMVGNLVSRYLRSGTSRLQVRSLLGKPDGQSSNVDDYDVGRVGWLALDPSFLELVYDKAGRLVAVRVYET